MPANLKQAAFNRFMVVSHKGKRVRIPMRNKPEPPAAIYFGVRFSDGVNVFMPRHKDAKLEDHAEELKAHALLMRGPLPKKDPPQIVGVEEACRICVRAIPECQGCDHSAAYNAHQETAKKLEETTQKLAAVKKVEASAKDQPSFSDGGKPIKAAAPDQSHEVGEASAQRYPRTPTGVEGNLKEPK